jgi:hypothetical protein
MAKGGRSAVLTLRVPPDLDRRIERAARRQRRTKSAVLREVLQGAFAGESPSDDPAREARRQSLLVSGRTSERETLEFLELSTERVTVLVSIVGEAQEGLALLADRSQPVALLTAALVRATRNYAARLPGIRPRNVPVAP